MNDIFIYKGKRVFVLFEDGDYTLVQYENTTKCKWIKTSVLNKKGTVVTTGIVIPEIPVKFIDYDDSDIVYQLKDLTLMIDTRITDSPKNLKKGDKFLMNSMYISVSDKI